MGKVTGNFYHGSQFPIETLSAGKAKEIRTKYADPNYSDRYEKVRELGVWLLDDPSLTHGYTGDAGVVVPVKLDHEMFELDAADLMMDPLTYLVELLEEDPRFKEKLVRGGYQGIALYGTADNEPTEDEDGDEIPWGERASHNQYVVFDTKGLVSPLSNKVIGESSYTKLRLEMEPENGFFLLALGKIINIGSDTHEDYMREYPDALGFSLEEADDPDYWEKVEQKCGKASNFGSLGWNLALPDFRRFKKVAGMWAENMILNDPDIRNKEVFVHDTKDRTITCSFKELATGEAF